MNILFIANAIVGEEPGMTGGEVRFIEIAKRWARQGYTIHLLTTRAGVKLCGRLGLDFFPHVISESSASGRATFIWRTLQSAFALPRSLDHVKPDIVYSANEQLYDVLPGLAMKRRHGRSMKWAVVVHWLPPFPPWKRRNTSAISATLFFLSERISVWLADRYADSLLAVSDSTLADLKEAVGNTPIAHSVECGVDLDEIARAVGQVRAKHYDAVFMKRLQAVKGAFDLIDIWAEVVAKRPDAKLLVIGEGIDGDRMRQKAEAKQLTANVEFAGVIYDATAKYRKLAQSRLFILPTYEENWAIVIGEAMAVGAPVIAYGLPELKQVWGNHFCSVPVGDKRAMAETTLRLLDDPSTARAIADDAQAFVRRYDWDAVAERELKFITG